MNFVLDIETIPRDLRAEPRKIQEYVWERVVRRGEAESDEPGLDEFLAGWRTRRSRAYGRTWSATWRSARSLVT